MAVSELQIKFYQDVRYISERLNQIFSLKFKKEIPHLSNPLMRWLDFRLRYVDVQPRKVILSNAFPKKDLPTDAQNALHNFVKMIESGYDLNPYQGRGLKLRNDTSSDKCDARTDLLWADWGIHHFHLSDEPIPQDRYFSKAADYLLFCLIFGDEVACIDVLRHPTKAGFANDELIETMVESWPDYMNQFKLNGILPGTENKYKQDELHELRASGITTCLTIKDDVYIGPGMGLTMASTSVKVAQTAARVGKLIRELATEVFDPKGIYAPKEIHLLGKSPDFSIVMTPRGLAVYEANTEYAFLLPHSSHENDPKVMSLHDIIFPRWACEQLLLSIDGM
ncbi:hypothetical protein JD499_07845 [Aeromonas enteropelogenes]|uniref:hypothetical protein n=1 Tax=Aeromonas enteropelogenes TaxID=29489 RepID=UPI00191E6900|nr:hypothetical protein [Aeromonas enteropelogenes]MBL0457120.1 hypothetical protein [Aeromonas enteropelogenes]